MLEFVQLELEEIWARFLHDAAQNRRPNGDVVGDYLRLREANDAVRQTGINWLCDAFLLVAAEANRRGARIQIEQSDDNVFKVGAATMRGKKINLKSGVRAFSIEAGFPRTPSDGFVRGNGLACARATHFGMPKHNVELILIRPNNQTAPLWWTIDKENLRVEFALEHLKNHFAVLLG